MQLISLCQNKNVASYANNTTYAIHNLEVLGNWYLYFPAPGPGLQFVFTGPGPQFVFTGPGPQFLFNGPGPQFVFTDPDLKCVFTGLGQSGTWPCIYQPRPPI